MRAFLLLLVAVFEIVHIVWDRSVKERDKYPVWVFLDEVQVLRVLALAGVGRSVPSSVCVYVCVCTLQDPMNLGAIMRVSYFLGVERIVTSLRNW